MLDGRPYGGRTGNAGHIGHIVLEPDGHPCTCGGRGCVETIAAGPMMVRWAREQGWRAPQRDLLAGSSHQYRELLTGSRQQQDQQPEPPAASSNARGVDAAVLAEAARAGDPLACAAFERSGYAVGMAVASVAAVCDLDLVVIGGGVAKAGPLLFDPIRHALRVHAGLSYLNGLRVVPAALGAQAGLVGAAALVLPDR